ncbi:dihydrofolate reductase [Pilibacter termitis]|uniref:Dihydrofolate reductase n=1 Tax=Pilibacter termitis TaxID=263852 RepID=A0A1T4M7W7_9ENTE|nr:dihydrofolate reductase [Pilibacter termitis]SJZ62937.1 dihydrofolate reductase [Pilibacter termitis]
MLTAIWAEDKNGLIGKNNQLPWHLPNDLQFFKEKTLGNTIVMGRETYEGMGKRPLPNRQTIVLTRNADYNSEHENVLVMNSVDEVMEYAKNSETLVMITGGATVYKAFEPYMTTLYRTVVQEEFEGDTYFPEWDFSHFELVETIEGIVDEKNKYPHVFERWESVK